MSQLFPLFPVLYSCSSMNYQSDITTNDNDGDMDGDGGGDGDGDGNGDGGGGIIMLWSGLY